MIQFIKTGFDLTDLISKKKKESKSQQNFGLFSLRLLSNVSVLVFPLSFNFDALFVALNCLVQVYRAAKYHSEFVGATQL